MPSDSGCMPPDWKPSPPPDVGSKRWLDDMAFQFMVEAFDGLPDRSGIFKLPNVLAGGVSYQLGYFSLTHSSYGKGYFRVDEIEAVPVRMQALGGDDEAV